MACTFCRLSYLCVFSAMRETRTERGDPHVSRGCWPSAWKLDRHETGRGSQEAVDSCLGAAPTLAPGSVPLLTQPGHSHQSSPVSYFSSFLLAVKGRDHSNQQVGRGWWCCIIDRQTSGTWELALEQGRFAYQGPGPENMQEVSKFRAIPVTPCPLPSPDYRKPDPGTALSTERPELCVGG